jgi:hypothetical protein
MVIEISSLNVILLKYLYIYTSKIFNGSNLL